MLQNDANAAVQNKIYINNLTTMRGTRLFSTLFILTLAGCTNMQNQHMEASKNKVGADSTQNWALLPFTKIDSVNPILGPGSGSFTDPILHKRVLWEAKDVFNPAIVNRDGKIYMLYRAQDKTGEPDGTSRIGLAVSTDAIHFTRRQQPVLYPGNDAFKKLHRRTCSD